MSIGLMVDILGLPGRGDEIEDVFIEMTSKVADRERGCLRYEVGRLRERPDEFVIWEIYANQDAFDQHRETAHFEDLMNCRLPPLIRERIRTLLDPIG